MALVIATLFPIISASDDIIRIQHLERGHEPQGQRSNNHKRTTDSLIRLYEAMESPLAATPVRISFVLFFAFLTVSLCHPGVRRHTIAQSGRSPPICVG